MNVMGKTSVLAAVAAMVLTACSGSSSGNALVGAGAGQPMTAAHRGVTPNQPNPLLTSPDQLYFTAVGAIASINAYELQYKGNFTASVPKKCVAIAVLQKTLAGPSNNFDVKALAAGRCNVTVRDSNGQSSATTVYVTTTGGGITK